MQKEEEEEKDEGGGRATDLERGPEFNSIPFLLLCARHSCSSILEEVFFHSSAIPPSSLSPAGAHFRVFSLMCECQRSCLTSDNDGDNDCNEDFFQKVAHAAFPSSPNLSSDVS